MADSEGMRKGSIVDIDQTVKSIREAVEQAERMVGIQIHEVYVGITGNHISLQPSRGVVAVSNDDREIGHEDIERVLQASRVIALPQEREIIGVVPKQFLVDGLEGIHDPKGMIGVRLEVEATIISGAKTAVHNLLRCVERADLTAGGLILTSLAAGELALSKDEKSMGTVLIDMGAGASTITVYEQDHMVATTTLPIGGEYITNDISIGLRTQLDVAEKLKHKFGCALMEDAEPDQIFKVSRVGSNSEKQFNQVDLAEIIEPRVREMFQLIRQEVHRLGFAEAPGGFVLTGGTVSIPGILGVAQVELGSSVRVAVPDYIGVRDPVYTGGVGIIRYVHEHIYDQQVSHHSKAKKKSSTAGKDKSGVLDKLMDWVRELI